MELTLTLFEKLNHYEVYYIFTYKFYSIITIPGNTKTMISSSNYQRVNIFTSKFSR